MARALRVGSLPATGPGLLSLAMLMVLNRPLHFSRQPASVSQIWAVLTQALAIGLPDPRDLRLGVGMCFATSGGYRLGAHCQGRKTSQAFRQLPVIHL